MKEYQVKREKAYLLPETVYRQALWAVKDLPRLRERLEELQEELDMVQTADPLLLRGGGSLISDVTGRRASEIALVSQRICAIEGALINLPEKYREGILEKLAYGKSFSDQFHLNTWKKWQQIYLYWVAKELMLY